jgi:hypothetical protein
LVFNGPLQTLGAHHHPFNVAVGVPPSRPPKISSIESLLGGRSIT